jgi:DNA-directed RNA polymerase specialized sigma24 family protein
VTRRRALAPPDAEPAAGGGRLTSGALDALLRYLDADRERAGERYETLRRGLVRFFECRGCTIPEELADETLDRVARKLLEGQRVHAESPGAYAHGFAKNVLHEWWRKPRLAAVPGVHPRLPGGETLPLGAFDTADERRKDGLDVCLSVLPEEDRALIIAYYADPDGEGVLIPARKELADRLGIGMNALRIRAHRIRVRLEECLRTRLATAEIETARRALRDDDENGR